MCQLWAPERRDLDEDSSRDTFFGFFTACYHNEAGPGTKAKLGPVLSGLQGFTALKYI